MKNTQLKMEQINDGWHNITLRDYIRYIDCYNSYKEDKNLSLYLLATVEKSDFRTISELPLGILNNKMMKWEFLQEDFTTLKVANPQIDLNGKIYMVTKDFNNLSLMQWQNIDELLKSTGENYLSNIHKLIAITCQLRTEFNDDTTTILEELILDQPMFYTIPSIVFFFSSDSNYVTNILTCLRQIQEDQTMELEVTLNKLAISTRSGGGMALLSRWRMKIFVRLMKFWLYLYKKFSLI